MTDHGMAGHQHSDTDRYAPRHKVPSWVIISAARYGLGRSTYITGMTHELIKDQFDHMHAIDQEVILDDMKYQFDLDEQPRRENSLRLNDEVRALRSLYFWCLERKKEK